jgi:fructose-1,6-bisphosphatase/inositol monophosphatase family enzyme
MTIPLILKRKYLFALEDVVRDVAEKILGYKGPVQDIKHIRGHEESSIDRLAYEWMMGSLENHLDKFPEEERFKGKYLFELHELQDIELKGTKEENNKKRVLRIDEIDGTTNTKRSKASVLSYAPVGAVSIAFCEDESLGSIIIGTVYDMHNRTIFSGMHTEGDSMAFCDRCLLDPKDFEEKGGDNSTRIMVVGYSNRERIKKGEIEQAIIDADKTKKDFRIYDGSRSTTNDILNILRNQYDAYIDPRALWPGSGAMLYPYDIAGAIPIAYGCGLEISDIRGNPIENYSGKNEPLTIIVTRKGLKDRFVEILEPVVKKQVEKSCVI